MTITLRIQLILLSLSFVANNCQLYSQQIPDTTFNPSIIEPAYLHETGTRVFIDAGHNNFHTMDNRYLAFARLLRKDGYVVNSFNNQFSKNTLQNMEILVISNARSINQNYPATSPTLPAFTPTEIEALTQWVKQGGALFLIADHMPFAGAASELGAAFGFTFHDGFALKESMSGNFLCTIDQGNLKPSVLTKGRSNDETVDHVITLTGQAFECPEKATSIITFGEEVNVHLCDTVWIFNDEVDQFSANNLSQLAYQEFGNGRVVVSGEAAMFSAQLAGPDQFKAGMKHARGRSKLSIAT